MKNLTTILQAVKLEYPQIIIDLVDELSMELAHVDGGELDPELLNCASYDIDNILDIINPTLIEESRYLRDLNKVIKELIDILT